MEIQHEYISQISLHQYELRHPILWYKRHHKDKTSISKKHLLSWCSVRFTLKRDCTSEFLFHKTVFWLSILTISVRLHVCGNEESAKTKRTSVDLEKSIQVLFRLLSVSNIWREGKENYCPLGQPKAFYIIINIHETTIRRTPSNDPQWCIGSFDKIVWISDDAVKHKNAEI